MIRKCNILITAASRRVILVKAFKNALEKIGLVGNVITADIHNYSSALYFSDGFHIVPPVDDNNYGQFMLELCIKNKIDLLIPTLDEELTLFGKLKNEFLENRVRIVCSDEATASVCRDKYETFQLLRKHDLPFVRTWLPDERPKDSLEFPIFLKPRRGKGSQGAHKLNNPRDYLYFMDTVDHPVLQDYIDGPEYTVDVLMDFQGNAISAVPRRRLEVRSGVMDKGRTEKNDRLIQSALKIAETLKIQGPANIQCRMADDKPLFFEVNPRFSGGIALTIEAGADFPFWILNMWLGHDVPSQIGEFEDDLYMLSWSDAVFQKSLSQNRSDWEDTSWDDAICLKAV